ncbi:AT-hook DNA-binding protein [Striga asiatica]|uniref:AT-hook DNA-binding protein n=1 Tax=Striga asiatica TaxID=4170 RepID=A0A5A7Q4V1_STRAF|nr:AT-hook DNA-binding protein [Striga asiatica]
MKREYAAAAEQQDQHLPPSTTADVLDHKFHLHPQPHLRRPYAASAECLPTSEDTESLSPTRLNPPLVSGDGATIEVVRRPRGRPPGSKNKPKPPVVLAQDAPTGPSMSPYVLELPAGVDVIDATARFCRRRGVGLCVLSGNGVVANVTLKQPSATPGATVTFHGHFDLLSISATILPAGSPPAAAAANTPFSISLAGPQGQVVGGLVAGPLVSAGTVYLVAATFNSPLFERLGVADHDGGAAGDGGRDSPQNVSTPMYSYEAADVIWAPTARQPQPQPPY